MKHDSVKIQVYRIHKGQTVKIPKVNQLINAGFPSPAMDYEEESIDLNKYLIKNSASTFFGRVTGNSMKNAGLEDGDLIIIDRSLHPEEGRIAVCFIDGEFTIKRIRKIKNEYWLCPENEHYPPIKVSEENHLMVWGIVTYVIKKV